MPSSPGALAIGDLNGDGKPDIVLTNSPFGTGTAGNLLVYLGNGDGTFKTRCVLSCRLFKYRAGDRRCEKDGKPDLVFGSEDQTSTTATLNVLPGNGDGTFGTAITSSLSFTGTTNLVVADFDGDGNPDVLLGQCCGLAFTVVAFGKGDGTFPTNYDLAPGASSAFVAAPDVNGDKHPDIVIAAGSAIEVFVNLYGTALPILAPTATTLTVAPNPATAGQTVTFTATVAENPGTTTPTGTVTFLNGTTALGRVRWTAQAQPRLPVTRLRPAHIV